MISTSYPEDFRDWRGVFIKNMVWSLSNKNGVSLSLWSPPGEKPQGVSYAPLPEESEWLRNLMNAGGIAHVIRSRRLVSVGMIVKLLYLLRRAYKRETTIDVIHVNWLQNAIPLWGIRKPAVISVLGNDFGLLDLPGMTKLLRWVISQRKCILAPNGEWMVPELERRFGDIAQVCYIPFGVDSSWLSIKREPDLEQPRKWLVISRVTVNKIGPLFDWGMDFFKKNDELHLFGPLQADITVPEWVNYHGPATPAELLEQWFPQAAGLITLSRHDEGRPQVILETMASGLPVLASDISAHANVITHKKSGWLASSREDFHEGLVWLSKPSNNNRTGKAAREWILQDIGTWDDCADRYIEAYQSVIKR